MEQRADEACQDFFVFLQDGAEHVVVCHSVVDFSGRVFKSFSGCLVH